MSGGQGLNINQLKELAATRVDLAVELRYE